jgi:SAM-dependent methyltransferase
MTPAADEQGSSDRAAIIVTAGAVTDALRDTLASCDEQTLPPARVILVLTGPAGNEDQPVPPRPSLTVLSRPGLSRSAARNEGLAAVSEQFLVFVESGDRLAPEAIRAGLAAFSAHLGAVLVYGAHRYVDRLGHPSSFIRFAPAPEDAHAALLGTGDFIGLAASALFRRDALAQAGGFDPAAEPMDEFDAYLRLSRSGPFASHDMVTAERSQAERRAEAQPAEMLSALRNVVDRDERRCGSPSEREAHKAARRRLSEQYGPLVLKQSLGLSDGDGGARPPLPAETARGLATALRLAPRGSALAAAAKGRKVAAKALQRPFGSVLDSWTPAKGHVRFGDFGRTSPINDNFGIGRGLPVDRHYIEDFLDTNSASIRGHVLEIGGNAYTVRFGGEAITRSDVLHVDCRNSAATLFGDISRPGSLPEAAFDCIVLTQTLHLIEDMASALRHLAGALKPGGSLLVTVPGVSAIDRHEWGDAWLWSLSARALTLLLSHAFGEAFVDVVSYGNVYAACAFLHGLATEELDPGKLAQADPSIPVIVAGRAWRAPDPD